MAYQPKFAAHYDFETKSAMASLDDGQLLPLKDGVSLLAATVRTKAIEEFANNGECSSARIASDMPS